MALIATAGDVSVAVDDRDLNHFALNPSCNVTWRYADHRKSALQALPMRCQCVISDKGLVIPEELGLVSICMYLL